MRGERERERERDDRAERTEIEVKFLLSHPLLLPLFFCGSHIYAWESVEQIDTFMEGAEVSGELRHWIEQQLVRVVAGMENSEEVAAGMVRRERGEGEKERQRERERKKERKRERKRERDKERKREREKERKREREKERKKSKI